MSATLPGQGAMPETVRNQLNVIVNNPNLPQPIREQIQAWLNQGVPPTDATAIGLINGALAIEGLPQIAVPGAAPPGQLGDAGAPIATATGVDAAVQEDQRAAAAAAQAAAQGVQDPATVPTAPPAAGQGGGTTRTDFDPNSFIGSTMFTGAQKGDQRELGMLMIQTLMNLGLDPFSGSEVVTNISEELMPYLTLVMRYSGMGEAGAAQDRGREFAGNFQNMIGSPGTFGQIREFGNKIAGNAKGIVGDMGDVAVQDFVNDLLGLTTAGGNEIENAARQRRFKQDQTRYGLAQRQNPAVDDYLDWLYSDPSRKSHPAYSGIAGLLGR
jgi:hypothetical protein